MSEQQLVGMAQVDVGVIKKALEVYEEELAKIVALQDVLDEGYVKNVNTYESLPWYKRLFKSSPYRTMYYYSQLERFRDYNWQYEGVKALSQCNSRLVTLNDSAVAWVLQYETPIL